MEKATSLEVTACPSLQYKSFLNRKVQLRPPSVEKQESTSRPWIRPSGDMSIRGGLAIRAKIPRLVSFRMLAERMGAVVPI